VARVGADVDGVGYSFTECSRHVVARHLSVDLFDLEDPKVWNYMTEQWGIDQETFWSIWAEDVAAGTGWLRFPPEDGYVEGITNLRDAGHQVVIVTNRRGGELATMKWIQAYDIPYDGLYIGRDKTAVNLDVLVDDWEQNWREVNDAGGRCLIWDQPWNHHVIEAERVYDWDDVLKAVS
jgi:5' nucleotidase, deoxy (Pyrimidine), cytosolic type C protein (NT5C)